MLYKSSAAFIIGLAIHNIKQIAGSFFVIFNSSPTCKSRIKIIVKRLVRVHALQRTVIIHTLHAFFHRSSFNRAQLVARNDAPQCVY